jgi:large subunit ribosomal protein L19e
MDLKVQKRLSAQIMDCSPKRVVFDNDRLDDIKQAITKRDLKLLIGDGAIRMNPMNATSGFRVRKLKIQKRKGRRKGAGSRKGSFNSRFRTKFTWMNNLRVQREFLKLLVSKNIVDRQSYRKLYLMSKGGYFRSKRHIKLFLEDHDEMIVSKNGSKDLKDDSDKASKKTKPARILSDKKNRTQEKPEDN